jgi:hypothetical protein
MPRRERRSAVATWSDTPSQACAPWLRSAKTRRGSRLLPTRVLIQFSNSQCVAGPVVCRGVGGACVALPSSASPTRGVERRKTRPRHWRSRAPEHSRNGRRRPRGSPDLLSDRRSAPCGAPPPAFCEPGHAFEAPFGTPRQPAPGRGRCPPRVEPRNAGGADDESAPPGPHSVPPRHVSRRRPCGERNENMIAGTESSVKDYFQSSLQVGRGRAAWHEHRHALRWRVARR